MKKFSIRLLLIMSWIQFVQAAGEPEVRFIQPAAGNSGPNVGVVVEATDADGKVREVKLYINNTLVRREGAAPYEWGTANTNSDDPALLNLAPGTYQLRAVAKDNKKKTATATRTITVLGSTPEPTVSATAVASGVATLNRNDSIGINQYLASLNGTYRLTLQGDGNLVLRNQVTGSALWSASTQGKNGTKLVLQGDGNLVLYTNSGSAVWSSQTNGKGAVKATMQNDGNFVLYTSSNAPVWATGTVQETDTGGGSDTGSGGSDGTDSGDTGSNDGGSAGDNDGTASSTGEFSTPSAALYSLNSSKLLGFPKHIDTGFGGNGHAETWDGRIFVRTRTDGWFASAFRPERIVRNSDGSVAFNQGAFGNSISLELKSEASDMQHNWLAIVPDPAVSGENPYPSNSAGSYQLNGTYSTYKAVVYHTSTRNGDNDQMGLRKATFIISNANTRDAQLIKADFTSSFSKLRLQNGADFRCIEPSVTIDGRLVVCQGHPDNNGRIDNLVYSWNPARAGTSNWRSPKSISNMYFDDRNANIEGVPFSVRFPIAEKPITDATGAVYNRGELVKGAYPWISRDGSELFYQASREGVSARRTGTTVVGRWTGWTVRHIDGPINRDRHRTSKLFLSSPGAFTTMWTPYKDIANLAIPYSLHGPVYPIFGSNTSDYSEVGFDDYLDGNYVMYLGMNEQLNRAGDYQRTRTNDTSGNFNNASLVGAQFPIEFNGQDQLVGRYGQAIHFRSNNYLNVTKNKGWNTLADGVSVDMWVQKSSGSGRIRLFNMQNGVELNLINGSTLSASIHDTNSNLVQINGSSIPNNSWTHVAFTYSAVNKALALYVNGQQVATKTATNFGTIRTSGAVRVGPDASNAQLILDEVKVSNVARRGYEIAHNANVRINKAPSTALANQVPDHLRSLLDNATGVDRFSLEAANLGEDLFSDTILSKQRTTSCATCHDAGSAFTDGLDIAKGNEPTDAGTRNTPMLLNRLFSSLQGWSGIDASMDTQALTPVAAAHEMNLPITEAVQRLRANNTYANRFQQVFGEAPNAENFPIALASFEAIQFAPKNRVDEFKEGNKSVLSASERRGLDLFEGKARCSGCHAGANFTDESFRNNGLAMNDDIGRADVTGRDRDHKLFKVPSLRELGLTGPYLHDGSISSLQEVVQAYNTGAMNVATRDTDIRPLELSNQEVSDIVAFLGALSENGASGGNTGGSTNVSEVSRVNGLLVGGAGSIKPGFTLYVFDNDQGSSSSNCVGGCVNAWPPVLVADSGASGVSGLSTITRGDGTKQAAYIGRPLYFFANDTASSDTKGDGVNGVWWIADDANSSGGGNTGGSDTGDGNTGDNTGGSDIGGDGWTQCASENGICNFSGTRVVAYGANGIFVQKTFTNGANCNNSTFGDPTPGVVKNCWYQNDINGGGDTGNTNQVPIVSFTQPSGSNVSANLGVVVEASDSDGAISQVQLFINNSLVRPEGGAPYEWGTANSSQADNALLNLVPGSYELRAVATDNEGASKTVTRTVTVQSNTGGGDNDGDTDGGDTGGVTTTQSATFEKRITSSSDDAEEQSNGSVNTTSSDLELTFDNSNQTVGMRFTNVTIPQGATITDAYIQFTTDEKNSGSASLRVFAHDIDDAPAFSTSSNNISNRAKTTASSAWRPAAWNTVGAAGNDQRTNELRFVVQEVVNRGGWRSGNAMAFIVTGSGERTAESYDGSSSRAPLLRIEYTYETSTGGSDDGSGGDNGGSTNAVISHVGSTADYDGSGDVRLNVPSGTREGDLLMAFVSRTDDLLPIKWNGWTAGASCYKTTNGQSDCHEIRHCSKPDGDYCLEFNGGNGRDLATVVFYKTATANEPSSHRFNLRNNHAGWGILTTLRGADNNNPIRSVATESNDNNPDSLFPSVNGNAGDLLMLSMAFDDTTARNDFGAPNGMQMFSFINGADEAGYVYGEILTQNGQTGSRKTSGPGGPNAKDALISLTVKPSATGGSSGGGTGGGTDGGSTGGAGGDAEAANNWLHSGDDLGANQYIASENDRYRLYLQGDGNIVLRDQQSGAALWSTGTHGKNGTRLVMQGDGNFVLYTSSGSAVWASGTNGTGASRVVINNDGSLAIYAGNNPVWAQNGTGDTGSGSGGGTGGGTGSTADGVKVAFIGDTGAGSNFQSVLNLIKSEGAELTLVAGDTSYSSSRDDDWDRMVRDTLGSSDPALVVAGNHDYGDSNFGDVRSYGQSRLNRQSGVQCSGAYAEKMTCNYKGIYFVMSAIGASGSRSEHEAFISNSLNNAPNGAWRVCAWHKNQRDMQVGGKSDETGWTAYESCRQKGAIIATGHEHSYSRTHLLSDMSSKTVASKSSTITVSEGKTFAFVSGLGGIGIRDQERGGDWWAKIYTSSQGARYGAMFGTFYEDRAEFYFKNINGQIIDQFTVMKGY